VPLTPRKHKKRAMVPALLSSKFAEDDHDVTDAMHGAQQDQSSPPDSPIDESAQPRNPAMRKPR
jgi:hypothetical protein